MKLAIILPAYNEELTVAQTIKEYAGEFPEAFYCVVDNNSNDNTYQSALSAITELGLKGQVLREKRQGKGFAVRTAISAVEADYFIMTDADCTYPATEAKKCLEKMVESNADIVTGDRHSKGDYKKENKRNFHNFGNMLIKELICRLFQAELKDILTGLRIFNNRFARNYPILSKGFELETEMTLHILDRRLHIIEVPITYKDRPEGSHSKLNTFRDGFRLLMLIFQIFRYYKPLLFFSSVGCLFILAGSVPGFIVIHEFLTTGKILHFPSAILATGLMLCAGISFAIGVVLDGIKRVFKENFELQLTQAKKP